VRLGKNLALFIWHSLLFHLTVARLVLLSFKFGKLWKKIQNLTKLSQFGVLINLKSDKVDIWK
jgi:hypothetical protein